MQHSCSCSCAPEPQRPRLASPSCDRVNPKHSKLSTTHGSHDGTLNPKPTHGSHGRVERPILSLPEAREPPSSAGGPSGKALNEGSGRTVVAYSVSFPNHGLAHSATWVSVYRAS